MENRNWIWPVVWAVIVALGWWLVNGFLIERSVVRTQARRFEEVLRLIDRHYVDSVDMAQFTDVAIKQALRALDPHTNYHPPQRARWEQQRLQGHLQGIGVEFVLLEDTIFILRVLPQGPAQAAGVRAGDRIVAIAGMPAVGPTWTQDSVVSTLRGASGTAVAVTLQRNKQRLEETVIVRNRVSLPAVDVAFMVDERSGYVHLSQFSAQAYVDFVDTLRSLKNQGMQRLVLDLRNNAGGFLHAAVQLADLFLATGQTIVTTQGLQRPSASHVAQRPVEFAEPLLVLINGQTASAAEIVVGALQDNDRAWVVGETSFGKGLVQEPLWLQDSAELRLTVSRYYTPNGRCIQQPYTLFSANTPTTDSLGGIMPDIVVPPDTTAVPCWQRTPARLIFLRYVADYVTRHYGQPFEATDATLQALLHTLCPQVTATATAKDLITLRQMVAGQVAYMQGGSQAQEKIMLRTDVQLQYALGQWAEAIQRVPATTAAP